MNNLDTIFDKPQVHLVNNGVTAGSVVGMLNSIDLGFSNVEDIIGDLSGAVLPSTYINSLVGSIGDVSKLPILEPSGVHFSSYVQSFPPGVSKEVVLDIIPDENSDITISPDGGIVWNRVSDVTGLTTDGDYCIRGKSVTFFSQPTYSFNISCAGTFPSSGDKVGFSPNVYPDVGMIERGDVVKPTITAMSGDRYSISIVESSESGNERQFGATLELEYGGMMSVYVDGSGTTVCPPQLISTWIKSGDEYTRLDVISHHLISNTEIQIVTDQEISDADTIVFSMSNITISDSINMLHTMLREHNHGRSSNSSVMDHSDLSNLIPSSSNPDITYAGSSIVGSSHPEYLHREGYKADPGTYNNAILGDLLLASTDKDSLYENILANSRKLVFGSTSSGVSINYRAAERDIHLYSQANGLTITSNINDDSIGLMVDGGGVSTYEGATHVSGVNNKVVFSSISDRSVLGEIESRVLVAEDVIVSGEISLGDTATISTGGSVITSTTSGSPVTTISGGRIDITSELSILSSTTEAAAIGDAEISNSMEVGSTAYIGFFKDTVKSAQIKPTIVDDEYIIDVLCESFRVDGKLSLSKNSGKTGGLRLGDRATGLEYGSLYSATRSGSGSLSTMSDLYMETGKGDLFLIKSTVDDIEGLAWGTDVQQLDYWPRAGIHAGSSSFKNLTLELSRLTERRGVSFGDFNHIWVTGADGGVCPSGWMILEAQNGVAFIDSASSATDCSSINYTDISARDVQSFGSVIAEKNIVSGGTISASEGIEANKLNIAQDGLIDGSLRVGKDLSVSEDLSVIGASTFNGGAVFNNKVAVNGAIIASVIQSEDAARFGGLAVFDGAVSFNEMATMNSRLEVGGKLVVYDGLTSVAGINSGPINSAEINATGLISAVAGIRSSGVINSEGTIETAESIIAQGDAKISGTVTAGDASVTRSLTVMGDSQIYGRMYANKGITIGREDNGVSISVSGASQFLDKIDVSGDISGYGHTSLATLSATSLSIAGQAVIKGTIIGAANLEVLSGNIKASGVYAESGTFGEINIGNRLTAETFSATDVSVDAGLVVGDTATVKGQTVLLGSLNVSGKTNISESLSVIGGFHQTDATAEFLVSAPAALSSTLTVASNITSDSLICGLGDQTSRITSTAISSQALVVDRVSTAEINGSYEASHTLGSAVPELGAYSGQPSWVKTTRIFNDGGAIMNGPTVCNGTLYVTSIKKMPGLDDSSAIDLISSGTYYA